MQGLQWFNQQQGKKKEEVSNRMHTLEKAEMKRIYQTKRKGVLLKGICDVQSVQALYDGIMFCH